MNQKNKGEIVLGCLAPHPPHLVYALNPKQNLPQPSGAGAWQGLLKGYESLRGLLEKKDFDVIIVHTPHWKTVVGHHFLGVPHFKDLSVDPIFPNLFQFQYEMDVDVALSEAVAKEAAKLSLVTKMMRNKDFRVDYGTITSCHLVHPKWDIPILAISSCRDYFYYSNEYGEAQMSALGKATRLAVEKMGRKALLLASTSLSHRHFTEEPSDPEDPRYESIYNENQKAWDERVLALMKEGKTKQLLAEMPDFIEQANAEVKDGGLAWLLSALDRPSYPAQIHGYGSVIGTGNGVVSWDPKREGV